MPVGDAVQGLSSVSSNSYLDIKPQSGTEWIIHNIYHEGMVELYYTDGTNYCLFDADSGPGVFAWYEYHVTNSKWIAVKNIETSSQLIGYDGVVSKTT